MGFSLKKVVSQPFKAVEQVISQPGKSVTNIAANLALAPVRLPAQTIKTVGDKLGIDVVSNTSQSFENVGKSLSQFKVPDPKDLATVKSVTTMALGAPPSLGGFDISSFVDNFTKPQADIQNPISGYTDWGNFFSDTPTANVVNKPSLNPVMIIGLTGVIFVAFLIMRRK